MKRFIGLVVAGLLLAGCATHRDAPTAGTALKLGKHHLKVSTKSREAQRAFDRGLILTFSFAHFAAEAEYRRAAELDPNLAMAYWGIALVNGPHINFPMVPPDRAKKAWEA